MNKVSKTEKIFYGFVLILVCIVCVVPIISILSISISSDAEMAKEGYSIFPRGFSLEGYKFALKSGSKVIRAYGISIFTTVVGTALGLLLNTLMAYVLSIPDFRFRKKLTLFVTIPMLLSGGLVPTYMMLTQYLHLKDNLLAVILPLAVVPWYIFLLRTFFKQIPYSLLESAKMDGASEFRVYAQIVLPLAKPALATVGMFLALAYWNDWYQYMLYIEDSSLVNLQYMLYRIMSDVSQLLKSAMVSGMSIDRSNIPSESMRMAMCLIAAGPMLVVFPFFQKYFVKGLTVGGVKG